MKGAEFLSGIGTSVPGTPFISQPRCHRGGGASQQSQGSLRRHQEAVLRGVSGAFAVRRQSHHFQTSNVDERRHQNRRPNERQNGRRSLGRGSPVEEADGRGI